MNVIIVTGISGAGKSKVANILEDMVFEKEQTTPNTFVLDLSRN